MSHQGHKWWRIFPFPRIITVSQTGECRKWTLAVVLVAGRPLHLLNDHSCGTAAVGNDIRYFWGFPSTSFSLLCPHNYESSNAPPETPPPRPYYSPDTVFLPSVLLSTSLPHPSSVVHTLPLTRSPLPGRGGKSSWPPPQSFSEVPLCQTTRSGCLMTPTPRPVLLIWLGHHPQIKGGAISHLPSPFVLTS